MSPNQPPTTDPIDDTNTLFTPEPQERTDINVVTQQDSENISQRLDFSSTPSQIERDRFQTHQQYYTEDWLTSHGEIDSSPLVEPSTFAHVPTPTVDSPTISRTQIRDVMDANTSDMKEITAAARSMVFMSNSSSQKRCTPKTSILAFLRRDVIDAQTKLLEQKGTSIFDTGAIVSQAKRAFHTKRGTAVAHKQFKQLKSNMQSLFKNGEIGMPLGMQHHRMLLEDIMGLSVGTEIVYLIHQSHVFVAGEKPTWWSRRINSIANDKKSRCHFVEFQNNLYWAVKATVRNNPEKDYLHKKIYTEDDISKGCTQKGGWGITIELSTGKKKNLLFSDFIEHPIQLQIWVKGCVR